MMAAHLTEVSFLLILLFAYSNQETNEHESYNLIPGKINEFTAVGNRETFRIYCYGGEERNFSNIWRTLQVKISATDTDFELFQGHSVSHVLQQYQDFTNSYFNLLPWVTDTIKLPAFNQSCIGIRAHGSFYARLDVIRVDYWKVLSLICGLFLFFMAPSFSKSVFFYYSSGVLLGVMASLLIVIFVLSRFIPRKTAAVSLLVAGWGLVLYLAQIMWSQLSTVIRQYKNLVLGYFMVAGMISFAACYRYGPVTDIRTMNLIKWTLQVVAMMLVFLSTEWQELAVTIILIILLIYIFPVSWSGKIKTYGRRRFFPPKIKLMTEEEYMEQASIETRRALENLRAHCNSPECNSWKLVNRLGTPLRFASFMEGSSHLTDQEILDYGTTSEDSIGNDDDDSRQEQSPNHLSNFPDQEILDYGTTSEDSIGNDDDDSRQEQSPNHLSNLPDQDILDFETTSGDSIGEDDDDYDFTDEDSKQEQSPNYVSR